jgi:hypothetical protein
VWKHNIHAAKLITPVIKQRVRDENFLGYKKPNDAIQVSYAWIRAFLQEIWICMHQSDSSANYTC